MVNDKCIRLRESAIVTTGGRGSAPHTEWVSCPTPGHTLQILRVGADRRVRPRKTDLWIPIMADVCLCTESLNLRVGEGCHALPS